MVSRLTKPTIASQGVHGTSEAAMVKEQAASHPKYMGLKQVCGCGQGRRNEQRAGWAYFSKGHFLNFKKGTSPYLNLTPL